MDVTIAIEISSLKVTYTHQLVRMDLSNEVLYNYRLLVFRIIIHFNLFTITFKSTHVRDYWWGQWWLTRVTAFDFWPSIWTDQCTFTPVSYLYERSDFNYNELCISVCMIINWYQSHRSRSYPHNNNNYNPSPNHSLAHKKNTFTYLSGNATWKG